MPALTITTKSRVVSGQGDPCPRCKRTTEIREHAAVTEKHLRQPYYFSRWFFCTNRDCATTLIMAERFKVHPEPAEPSQAGDIVMQVLDGLPC